MEIRKLFYENKYSEVIKNCEEILKTDYNNQRAIGYKARSLNFLNKSESALKLINNGLILYPKNYHFHLIKAEILGEFEDYENALKCYEKVFEIGVDDEVVLDFIKMDYKTCFSFIIDQLIDKEKYKDAWEYYNQKLEIEGDKLEQSQKIKRFKNHVAGYIKRSKRRIYYVKSSSKENLLKFLKDNGFKIDNEYGILFKIDVIDKTCSGVSVDEIDDNTIISESKFYDKVNFSMRDNIKYGQIHNDEGFLVYEGYTLHGSPYGFGIAYFQNGEIYREGIFDIKGIVQGKEYYPSGQLRFEGQWTLTYGYGPNAPYIGNAYSEDGGLIYSGQFEIKRGGVGWPMIIKPKGFGHEQKNCPKISYLK